MSIFEYDEEEAKEVFREDGRIEGRAQGMLETKIADIFELLEDIGEIPQELQEKINAETNIEILRKMLKLAAKADSIEEFERRIFQ